MNKFLSTSEDIITLKNKAGQVLKKGEVYWLKADVLFNTKSE
jgi:hypothetical protein